MSTDITDDYVAQILKRDAERKDTNRFVANGLGSLLNNTRPRNRDAPKPNTRFLKHIVKAADSHNAALLKKEAEESRARLRGLKRDEKERRRSRSRSRSPKRERERRKEGGRKEREVYSARRRHEERSRGDGKSRRGEERKRSGRERESPDRHDWKHSRRESKSPERIHRRPGKGHSGDASDSDPLDDILGPKPSTKPRARGRGAHKDSDIDARFDSKYNPKEDVALDKHEDDDDWEMALEAMRDRAKWRKSGAERLRAAGFTEDEVGKWEKGGGAAKTSDGEGDIESVRWRKKGEGREWDRHKVVEGEYVELRPEWGRLKDT